MENRNLIAEDTASSEGIGFATSITIYWSLKNLHINKMAIIVYAITKQTTQTQ